MRPDAIPVRPVGSRAVVPAAGLGALFGKNAVLGPSANVEVVRRGEVAARAPVEAGPALALHLDTLGLDAVGGSLDGLSLRGPVGSLAVEARPVRSRLVLPDALRRAWGLEAPAALDLGGLAVSVPVEGGPDLGLEAERALWLAAGRPATARWLPGLALAPPSAPDAEPGVVAVEARVVTETDVRQARLKRRRIRLRPGQIVTPAARALAHEWGVFAKE